ncbi:MAG: FeoB-associated Cys-rich membrane protein [Nonlabens sp.]|jgi:hypothetical protein|nr:FeoB-associated Cys-rich membrane protein [Nonlabens sp.]
MIIAQYIVVGIIAVVAVGWLLKTYVLPSKKGGNCGDGDCGCH